MQNHYVVSVNSIGSSRFRFKNFYCGKSAEGNVLKKDLDNAKKYNTLKGAMSGVSALWRILNTSGKRDYYINIWLVNENGGFGHTYSEGPF